MKKNKILLSQSSILNHLCNTTSQDKKELLNFAVNVKDFKIDILDIFRNEINLIKTRNFPYTGQILSCIENKKIIFVVDKKLLDSNTKNSIVISPLMNDKEITEVVVNITSLVKYSKDINRETGDIVERVVYKDTGKYETLYELLLMAFLTLKTESLLNNPATISLIRDIYIECMSSLISYTNGNPIDGDTFRLVTGHFFHNGEIDIKTVGQGMKINPNIVDVIDNKYPDFSSKHPNGITLEEYIGVLNSEFKHFSPAVSLDTMLSGGIKCFSPNGCFAIDNIPTLISIIVWRARKGKEFFTGYVFKRLERDANVILSKILQNIR